MKAIVFRKYGTPDVLQLEDVEKPRPQAKEVVMKVHAASVNDWDWQLMQGTPLVNRLMFGLFKPRLNILGIDVAGTVVSTGSNVTAFQAGDEVFGDLSAAKWGGFAEYASAPESALTHKPPDLSFEEAAAMPQAGLLALQGILQFGSLHPGHKVLINGAGGGMGTVAIQIVKALGAEVTGVDRAGKLDVMRSLGADHVIDFTQEDFTKSGRQYDFILDAAAHHSVFDYKRSLRAHGQYVMAGGASARIIQIMLMGPLLSKIGNRKLGILAHKPNYQMPALLEYWKQGHMKPVIDRTFPLEKVPGAMAHFGSGEAKGKVVIRM